MKRSKKLQRNLERRIYAWDQFISKNPGARKAYKKPGSGKKG